MIEVIYFVLLVQKTFSNISIPKEDSKIEETQEYLNNLLKTLEISNNDLIITNIDWNHQFGYPCFLITDISKPILLETHRKGSIFIFKNLNIVLEYFAKQLFWEPTSKFIVISEEEPGEIFKIVSKYYIYNIMVLFQTKFYTNFPFENENSRNFEINFRRIFKPFPKKHPTTWKNTTMKVLLKITSPYVMCTDCALKGLEINLLETIQSVLKFQIKYINKHFDDYGTKYPNGTYTKMYGMLQNEETDLALGLFSANLTLKEDFQMSFSIIQDDLVWVVPKARNKNHWSKFASIFTPEIWICIYLTIILSSGIFFILGKFNFESRYFKKPLNCFLNFILMLLGSCCLKLPESKIGRTVFMSFSLFSFVLVTSFQANLISFLTLPKPEKQIGSIGDIIQANLKIGLHEKVADSFRNSNYESEKYIYKKYVFCKDDNYCLRKVAFDRDYAVVKPRRFIKFAIPYQFVTEDGKTLIYTFRSNLYSQILVWYFPKGYPIVPQIDELLLKIKSGGFLVFWDRWISYVTERKLSVYKTFVEENMTMKEMNMFFILFVGGMVVAIVVFLCELIIFRGLK